MSYPQDMVFYYLTQAQSRQYSSSNLCSALPSPGRFRDWRTGGGIWLVDPSNKHCIPTFMAVRALSSRSPETRRPLAVSLGTRRLSTQLETAAFHELGIPAAPRSTSCSN